MKSKSIFVLLFFVCFKINSFSQDVKLKKVWESDTTLTTPESVFYNAKDQTIYVSCINGAPSAENSKSFIAKIGTDGKIQKLKLTEDLNSTKGLEIVNEKLYVTEMFKLVEIDAKSGKVIKKYEVPEAKFLNDVSIDRKLNIVYFTDMRSNRIWILENGKIVKLTEDTLLKNPNGVLFENGKLLVGNGDGKLLSYDLKTKKFTVVADVKGGIDGIAADGKKGYFVSEWRGKVWHINPLGKTSLLLDSVNEKINTADIDYIPSKKLLIIPTFFKNKVVAYSVE